MQPPVDSCLIGTLMVSPNDFLFFVGNVEAYFTHTIHVRECVSPIVKLFYGCVPIVIEVGLITFASLWSLAEMKTTEVVFYLLIVKVPAYIAKCHSFCPP